MPLQSVVLEQEEIAEELTPVTANTSSLPVTVINKGNEEMSLSKVIGYLQYLNNTQFQSTILKSENARLKHELSDMRRKNEELQKRINELEKNSVTMQEDYETLMKIMNRARKLVLFDEDEPSASTFKMDRNGNLEKLAE